MQANQVTEMIEEIKQKMDARGGLKNAYFVACGGSKAAIYPGYYCLQRLAKDIPVETYNSSEFVNAPPAALGKQSLVICCSLKATAETVDAVLLANSIGAISIAMTGSPQTAMAQNGQYALVYSNGDNQVYSDSNQANSLRIAFEILHKFEGFAGYEKAMAVFGKLDEVFATARQTLSAKAKQFAKDYQNDEIFYIMGCGALYGTAFSMACCHLMEMQWRHAILMHCGEYFHGPFETTMDKTAVVLLRNVGATRPLDDRVERFLQKHNGHYTIIDAADTGLTDAAGELAEFFAPVVMLPLERYFVEEMSYVRGHSMDERRYMWKEEY